LDPIEGSVGPKENVVRADRMIKVCSMQKTAQWVGHACEIGLEFFFVSIK
jgi:hypothetical protein